MDNTVIESLSYSNLPLNYMFSTASTPTNKYFHKLKKIANVRTKDTEGRPGFCMLDLPLMYVAPNPSGGGVTCDTFCCCLQLYKYSCILYI
jgi:hypothetical protein